MQITNISDTKLNNRRSFPFAKRKVKPTIINNNKLRLNRIYTEIRYFRVWKYTRYHLSMDDDTIL